MHTSIFNPLKFSDQTNLAIVTCRMTVIVITALTVTLVPRQASSMEFMYPPQVIARDAPRLSDLVKKNLSHRHKTNFNPKGARKPGRISISLSAAQPYQFTIEFLCPAHPADHLCRNARPIT